MSCWFLFVVVGLCFVGGDGYLFGVWVVLGGGVLSGEFPGCVVGLVVVGDDG